MQTRTMMMAPVGMSVSARSRLKIRTIGSNSHRVVVQRYPNSFVNKSSNRGLVMTCDKSIQNECIWVAGVKNECIWVWPLQNAPFCNLILGPMYADLRVAIAPLKVGDVWGRAARGWETFLGANCTNCLKPTVYLGWPSSIFNEWNIWDGQEWSQVYDICVADLSK